MEGRCVLGYREGSQEFAVLRGLGLSGLCS